MNKYPHAGLTFKAIDWIDLTPLGLRDWLLVSQSTGFTYCYSYLTLAGFMRNGANIKIPERLNVKRPAALPDERKSFSQIKRWRCLT